jgi:hypothetical protein
LEEVKEVGLNPDHIYNADESCLFWRVLPNMVHRNEDMTPERKISKE